MRSKSIQYTIRDIPPRVDQCLRERCARYGGSLNKIAVLALSRAVGLVEETPVCHDLDDLSGTWINDPAFDAAIEAQDRVDKELWK